MTRAETAVLLGLAAARDCRKIGDADVAAWHEDLHDLDFADAKTAVSRHYRDSTDRVMPAHVRRHVRAIRAERRQQAEVRALPSPFENDPSRTIRVRRGLADCRQVVDAIAAHLGHPAVTEPAATDRLRAITAGPAWTAPDDPRDQS